MTIKINDFQYRHATEIFDIDIPYYFISHTQHIRNGFDFVNGYFNHENKIDIMSDQKKAVTRLNDSIFGYMFDFLNEIFIFYSDEKHKEYKLIILCHQIYQNTSQQMYYDFIENYLKENNITYQTIFIEPGSIININNFVKIETYRNYLAPEIVYEKTRKYATTTNKNKKVFISRKYANRELSEIEARTIDHKHLEEIFESLGFEILYAENFTSFVDQINYFNEVSVLAAVSGSGLTNSILMNPGSKVIELVMPFPLFHNLSNGTTRLSQELHHYYTTTAYFKKHQVLLIPNEKDPKNFSKDIIETIRKFAND